MHILIHSQQKGFTLVETLVSITILLLVIIGPMTIAQKGIQNAYYAREQMTAIFLAQEAIEAARELRDNEALDAFEQGGGGTTWSWYGSSLNSACKGDGRTCAFNGSTFAPCAGTGPDRCRLYQNADTGKYSTISTDTASPFVREVNITESSPGIARMYVDVKWTSQVFGGATRTVHLETWLYDHYKRYQ